MTLAELAARGAFEMFWFQAASVSSEGAVGEVEAGGAGKTGQEPRSGEGPRAPAGGAAGTATTPAARRTAAPTAAPTRVRSRFAVIGTGNCERDRFMGGARS